MDSFEQTAFVTLFADWSGRPLATASPRSVRALPREGSRDDYVFRLRAVGHSQAATLLEDDEMIERARCLIDQRAVAGWQPLLPPLMPPKLREQPGASAPPLLWAYGYAPALRSPGVGIVGSRVLNPSEARFASAAGEVCAQMGMPIFSGGAAGADSFGAIGAARRGGSAVHFLPGGCSEPFGPIALMTPNPDAPAFDRVQALVRNKWVYAASEATIVVASRFGGGGSWAGAIAAMRARLGRIIVFLSDRPSPGNEALAKLGATPVRCAAELREVMGHPLQPRLVV